MSARVNIEAFYLCRGQYARELLRDCCEALACPGRHKKRPVGPLGRQTVKYLKRGIVDGYRVSGSILATCTRHHPDPAFKTDVSPG